MMPSPAFHKALAATGYLSESGDPVLGLARPEANTSHRLRGIFTPGQNRLNADAVFSTHQHSISIFKDAGHQPPAESQIRQWHETAWNFGLAPLLWVVTPTSVRLYDCYASAQVTSSQPSVPAVPLDEFQLGSNERIQELKVTCGRAASETGAFWSNPIGRRINRQHRVDMELLQEIAALERCLNDLTSPQELENPDSHTQELTQRLIGRCIFIWYLKDRGLANPQSLPRHLNCDLSEMFATREKAFHLFDWLREIFDGDLFPMNDPGTERGHLTEEHLAYIKDFVEGVSLISRQRRLFRFQFDAIPIELISGIYEQFAQSRASTQAKKQSLHYTPIELVHLVLDQVCEGISADARVLDPACGSGAFLVEVFRRLVWRATQGRPAGRDLVRRILYEQLYGIDINKSALGIAAFSLYLAALELDEDPITDISQLRFERLINQTLFAVDALEPSDFPNKLKEKLKERPFDAIVGNPPWTYVNPSTSYSMGSSGSAISRRHPDHRFLMLADELTGSTGRIGMVIHATPFFSLSPTVIKSRYKIIEEQAPCAILNLSHLRREKLFPKTDAPALLFLSRCTLTPTSESCLIGSIPWSPNFRRTGVFEFDPSVIQSVPVSRIRTKPWALKALALGTVRDSWLLDRLERTYPTLDEALTQIGVQRQIHRGEGFKKGKAKKSPMEYFQYPMLTHHDYSPIRLDSSRLKQFNQRYLDRTRSPSIFHGPLVLCPKSLRWDSEPSTVRYTAAVFAENLAYDKSFFGISLASSESKYSSIISGILNSSLTIYQLLLTASCLGVERPAIRYQDVLALRVPWLQALEEESSDQVTALVNAECSLAAEPTNANRWNALDEAVLELYQLRPAERTLVTDGAARARQIFGGIEERRRAVTPPSREALHEYGRELARTVNAYLRARGQRHLEVVVYGGSTEGMWRTLLPGVTVIRFVMVPGAPDEEIAIRVGQDSDLRRLARLLRDAADTDWLPDLNKRRHLRCYNENEIFIVKPSESRYWTKTRALNDADTILGDHWGGTNDSSYG